LAVESSNDMFRVELVILGMGALTIGLGVTWVVAGIFQEKTGYDQPYAGDHSGAGATYVLLFAALAWVCLCVPCCLLAGPLLIVQGLTGVRIGLIDKLDPHSLLCKLEEDGDHGPYGGRFTDDEKAV
jgi:hypothetical protein